MPSGGHRREGTTPNQQIYHLDEVCFLYLFFLKSKSRGRLCRPLHWQSLSVRMLNDHAHQRDPIDAVFATGHPTPARMARIPVHPKD